MNHRNILFICEGSDDEKLLTAILKNYTMDIKFNIYKYNTNIHVFTNYLFQNYSLCNGELAVEDIDMIQILKEFRYEELLDHKYTDILFVFDYDPQDPRFNTDKLVKLMNALSDSTALGQLFINYPMVEAAIDFTSLPDPNYMNRICELKEIRFNGYKNTVKKRSIIKHIDQMNKDQLRIILKQTYEKMMFLSGDKVSDYAYLLKLQNEAFKKTQTISVISTCLLFVRDYNSVKFLNYLNDCDHECESMLEVSMIIK